MGILKGTAVGGGIFALLLLWVVGLAGSFAATGLVIWAFLHFVLGWV